MREQIEAHLGAETGADRDLLESLSVSLSWDPAYLYPDGIRKDKEEEGLEGGINRGHAETTLLLGSGVGRRMSRQDEATRKWVCGQCASMLK